MRHPLTAAALALLALASSAFVAFARDGDVGVLVGRIVDTTLSNHHADQLNSFVLRVTDRNEPVDDNNSDPSFYRVDVNGDTSEDLNGVSVHDLVGEHAVVEGNDLNVGDRAITADQFVVLGRDGNDNNSNDNNANFNDNEDNGPGMSAAAHFKNDHVPPGPGRGAFMRCVHDAERNGAAADDETFRRCADRVNGDSASSDGDGGNGNGHGNAFGHDKHGKD